MMNLSCFKHLSDLTCAPVVCYDCGCDATKDRNDNGDNKIRCSTCALKQYRKDQPFDVLHRQRVIDFSKITS